MKIALIGDMHIGARNSNTVMANHQIRFFEEQVFPYMLENDIDTIIQTGDLFDQRKYSNHIVLHEWHKRFFQIMRFHGFNFYPLLAMVTPRKTKAFSPDKVTRGRIFFLSPLKKTFDMGNSQAIFTFVRQTLFLK